MNVNHLYFPEYKNHKTPIIQGHPKSDENAQNKMLLQAQIFTFLSSVKPIRKFEIRIPDFFHFTFVYEKADLIHKNVDLR